MEVDLYSALGAQMSVEPMLRQKSKVYLIWAQLRMPVSNESNIDIQYVLQD